MRSAANWQRNLATNSARTLYTFINHLIRLITVLWTADDARVQTVRDAIEFWNRVLTELGTPFRLGPVTYRAGALTVDQLKVLSERCPAERVPPIFPPTSIKDQAISSWPYQMASSYHSPPAGRVTKRR